ncbi:MAG: MFS transporter [Methanoregulaceae archaeon]|nr:MFS transporter [Methanoregulaceae archaeon]
MKARLPVFLGVFSVMALSNAVVPVLPGYSPDSVVQGAIYASYFFGALLFVLPSGILADRYGELPLIGTGLILTVAGGFLLAVSTNPVAVVGLRFLEGAGAGLFITAALSLVNVQPDHVRLTGIFMALLNIGLVTGLAVTGWAVSLSGRQDAGLLLFSVLSVFPLVAVPVSRGKTGKIPLASESPAAVLGLVGHIFRQYFWLWLSALVLIGITGVVTSLYPGFSGESPELVGLELAAMNGATVVAVLLSSQVSLPPVPTIRVAALLEAGSIILTFYTPWGFIALGAFAGVVMIAQLAFLAQSGEQQGSFMGLFNVASYGGMALLPFVSGVIAATGGYTLAFLVATVAGAAMAVTVGRCECRVPA